MKKVKSLKPTKPFHTSASQKGSGDFYGQAKRNPMGKMVEGMGERPLNKKGLKKPPRSLA